MRTIVDCWQCGGTGQVIVRDPWRWLYPCISCRGRGVRQAPVKGYDLAPRGERRRPSIGHGTEPIRLPERER